MRKEYKKRKNVQKSNVYTREEKRQYAIKMYRSPPTGYVLDIWWREFDAIFRDEPLIVFEIALDHARMALEALPADDHTRDQLCFKIKYLYAEIVRCGFNIDGAFFIMLYGGDTANITERSESAWRLLAEEIILRGRNRNSKKIKTFRFINYPKSSDYFPYVSSTRKLTDEEVEYTRQLLIEKYYEIFKSKKEWSLVEILSIMEQLECETKDHIEIDTTTEENNKFSSVFNKNLIGVIKNTVLDFTDKKLLNSASIEDLTAALQTFKALLGEYSKKTRSYDNHVRVSSKEICIILKFCKAVLKAELTSRRPR